MFHLATLLLVLPGVTAPQAPTQDGPAVKTVADLASHLGSFGKRAFQCDFALDVKGEGQTFHGNGQLAWLDGTHFALEFSGTGSGPDQGEDAGSIRLVADGSFLYFEAGPAGADAPGPPQVMKVSTELLGSLPRFFGANMLQGPNGPMDATSMWKTISGLRLTPGEAEGAVRYQLTLDSSVIEDMGEDRVDLRFDLDRKNRFPKALHVQDGKGMEVALTTSSLAFPESFSAERFRYTAPEGAMVQDMTPIFQMMLQQMEQQQEGDADVDF